MRQKLHLCPPQGFMGDPNGLCFFGGKYHVCFQYYPKTRERKGSACWGHFESADLISWLFTGTIIEPDAPWEKNGAYSGCAVASAEKIEFFYTGNVKEDGEHDYITSGRRAYVLRAESRDGRNVGKKQVLLSNEDYPSFCSCHVRDPAVFYENGVRRMVLGARTLSSEGCVLFYEESGGKWRYVKSLSAPNLGYMWECPNVFAFNGQKYLSVCPQGAPLGNFERQNENGAGYFPFEDFLGAYHEWDGGFDFYAPQTFRAPDDRVLLFAWLGVPDTPYDTPEQNCLSLPRELSESNGEILQNPARELLSLRGERVDLQSGETACVCLPFDMEICSAGDFEISFCGVFMTYSSGVFTLVFADEAVGGGRNTRRVKISPCGNARIIADTSSIEIFLAHGRKTLSTRFFPQSENAAIRISGGDARIYDVDGIAVEMN